MRAVLLQHTQEQVPDSVGKSRALRVRPKANAACSPTQRDGHQFSLALACRDVGGQLGTIRESGSRERSIVRRVAGLDLLRITVYLALSKLLTFARLMDGKPPVPKNTYVASDQKIPVESCQSLSH
jgi:hypothetical protein